MSEQPASKFLLIDPADINAFCCKFGVMINLAMCCSFSARLNEQEMSARAAESIIFEKATFLIEVVDDHNTQQLIITRNGLQPDTIVQTVLAPQDEGGILLTQYLAHRSPDGYQWEEPPVVRFTTRIPHHEFRKMVQQVRSLCGVSQVSPET